MIQIFGLKINREMKKIYGYLFKCLTHCCLDFSDDKIEGSSELCLASDSRFGLFDFACLFQN
jgi:hypothetical protein